MEKREIGGRDAVEVDGRVVPRVVEMCKTLASLFVWNERRVDELLFAVLAAVEPAAEQRDAHDAEHQPEDEADEQHVEDGRDRLDQSVHHHLRRRAAQAQLYAYTYDEVTSQSLWSRYDRNFVGITRHNALS